MLGQRLRKDMHIKFSGQEYSIEQRLLNNDLQLKHIASGTLSTKPESALVEALFTEDAELLGSSNEVSYLQRKRTESIVSDFAALDESDLRKIEAKRRLNYIAEISMNGITEFGKSAEKLQPFIDKVAKAIGDPKPPSCVTLSRWIRDYIASGEDVRALAPAYKARGKASENDGRGISDDLEICLAVKKIMIDVINEEYLSPTRPTVQSTHKSIIARIAQVNQFRNKGDKLPTPHKNTVYRAVYKLDPYEKDKARFGKRIADLRHKVNQQGVRPSRPLERVEIDDTKLDLFVIDEKTGLPLGRPWLMLAIDVSTKMIVGYYLSFMKPSYLSVMQCLLHSIRPKTYVKELYPEIVHSWDAYGLPELLVSDNAKQYYSASFDEACLQLGIVTQYAPVRHPYYKPSIERVFGSINTMLLHQMPGTTFSSISDKWDYDPKKNAVISMGLLEKLLHNWIIDVYLRSYHRGIGDVPARLWEIGTKNLPPALPFSAKELNILLGHIEHRVISNSGIELFGGLYYNDPCLSSLRVGAKKREKFKVKYDPMEISVVHVYDSRINDYLPIPAVDQEYTKGLTLWQHKVIKREARTTAEEYVDIVELSLARDRIKKMVAENFNATSKSGTNVRVAQWLGIGQEQTGRLEVSDTEANGGQDEQRGNPGKAPRLSPHANATAGVSNFPSAIPTNRSANPDTATDAGSSGVETEPPTISQKVRAKNSDRRPDSSAPIDPELPSSQDSQEDANLSTMPPLSSEPTTDPVLPTVGQDLVLEGWESGYDLPRRSR